MREELLPVASPGYAHGLPASDDIAALAGATLVHDDEPNLPSTSWAEFFHAAGMHYEDDGEGLRLTSHVLALQAAIAGQGVALGWSQLVEPILEQGLLVPVGRRRLLTHRAFYLLRPTGIAALREGRSSSASGLSTWPPT